MRRRVYRIAIAFGLIVGSLAGLAFEQAYEIFAQSPPDGKLAAARRLETRAPRLLVAVVVGMILGGCTSLLPRNLSSAVLGSLVGGLLGYGAANIYTVVSLPSPVLVYDWHANMRRVTPVAASTGAAVGLLFGILAAACTGRHRQPGSGTPSQREAPGRPTPPA